MKHQRVIHAQCAMYHIYMHTQAFEVWLRWDIIYYYSIKLIKICQYGYVSSYKVQNIHTTSQEEM